MQSIQAPHSSSKVGHKAGYGNSSSSSSSDSCSSSRRTPACVTSCATVLQSGVTAVAAVEKVQRPGRVLPFTKVGPLAHPVRSQTLAHRVLVAHSYSSRMFARRNDFVQLHAAASTCA
jgi:hypothetical protein